MSSAHPVKSLRSLRSRSTLHSEVFVHRLYEKWVRRRCTPSQKTGDRSVQKSRVRHPPRHLAAHGAGRHLSAPQSDCVCDPRGYALVEPISVNLLDGLSLVATGFWLHPQRREKRRSECCNAIRASN